MSIFNLRPLGSLTMTELNETWTACQVILGVLDKNHHFMAADIALLSADISLEISDRRKPTPVAAVSQ